MTYEQIRTITTIFKGLKLRSGNSEKLIENHSKWDAIYYVLLIKHFSNDLASFVEYAHDSNYTINRRNLELGRKILLENGFIAQVFLPPEDGTFNNESYLPVNPSIIWDENKGSMGGLFESESLEFREKIAKSLGKTYLLEFKKHGFRVNKGSITALYSSQWLTYTLINNMLFNKKIEI